MARSRIHVPHTLVLLFGMVVLAYALTWVLPQGEFERVDAGHGREKVVPGSFHPVDEEVRLMPTRVFTAIPQGFEAAGEIIFFVFLIGGAFGVFRATGAADALIGRLLEIFGGAPWILIAGGMLLFAIGSSTIGMAEEYLPFVPMLLALCIAMKLDAVTAVGILCVGYGIGYGTAMINPFTVMIAWDVAEAQPLYGLGFRAVLMIVLLAVGFHHVWRYARRVQADPGKSLVHDVPAASAHEPAEYPRLNGTHVAVLVAIVAALALLVYGLIEKGWYLVEMGGLFLALTVAFGLIARLGFDRTAVEFCKGAAELTTTALLIGVARTIEVVLDQGQVIDTIVHGIAQPLEKLGPQLAAIGMLVTQSACNLFIPSGSGQAYVTMPIMAPLADLTGLSRQISVLAYQFGDGFTNILVPTNAVLIGILGLAGIPYDRWFRFVFPFILKVWLVAAIALIVAVWIGF